MRYGLVLLSVLFMAACTGVRDHIPADADHPLLWWVGLTLGFALLSTGVWMSQGVARRWGRREERGGLDRRWNRRTSRWERRGWVEDEDQGPPPAESTNA